MCMMTKGAFTCLSYNTNNGKEMKQNQYGGTSITLNIDMRSRMTNDSDGGDPTKLGRWTWARIGGKDDSYDMRDKIIHLHATLATKIEKIQIEVDKLLGQFFTRQVPWSPIL